MPGAAPDGIRLHERVVTLHGDPARPVTLQTTIFTPDGPGPFPAVVLNHGATRISRDHRGERQRLSYPAFYFLSRGYAVIQPMARGFAESGGELDDEGCDFAEAGLHNARDLVAVVSQVASMPFVDPHRIVMAGQSFGGWSTLALGALDAADVRGLIAFAPTLRSSACPLSGRNLIDGAGEFGRTNRTPLLWFYGDNDSLVPPGTWRGMIAAYRAGGAPLEAIDAGAVGTDSHQLVSNPASFGLWIPPLDAFLTRLGLPSQLVQPGFLPLDGPKPSDFARIDDVEAVPYLSEAGRAKYRQFLGMKLPRAIVIAPDGTLSAASGGYDPLSQSLDLCRKGHLDCAAYAVGNHVVWHGAKRMREPVGETSRKAAPAQPMTIALTVASGRPDRILFATSVGADCTVRSPPQFTIAIPATHGTTRIGAATGSPHFPQGAPRAACNSRTVAGTQVMYQPDSGFTGPDVVAFDERDATHSMRRITVTLTVR